MITYVNKLNSPSTYFIHCDLINRNQNFFNREKTAILTKFDIKGKPYEKVRHDASLQRSFRDFSTDSNVNTVVSLSASEIKMASYLISTACQLNLNWK